MAYPNKKEMVFIYRFMTYLSLLALTVSMAMTWVYGTKFYKVANQNKVLISDIYGVPIEVANSLVCFEGYLHYPNQGNFSGLLAISPNKQCDKAELEKQKYNQYFRVFVLNMILMFTSIFLTIQFLKK